MKHTSKFTFSILLILMSFLMIAQKQDEFQLTKVHVEEAFLTAWDSIKL